MTNVDIIVRCSKYSRILVLLTSDFVFSLAHRSNSSLSLATHDEEFDFPSKKSSPTIARSFSASQPPPCCFFWQVQLLERSEISRGLNARGHRAQKPNSSNGKRFTVCRIGDPRAANTGSAVFRRPTWLGGPLFSVNAAVVDLSNRTINKRAA